MRIRQRKESTGDRQLAHGAPDAPEPARIRLRAGFGGGGLFTAASCSSAPGFPAGTGRFALFSKTVLTGV